MIIYPNKNIKFNTVLIVIILIGALVPGSALLGVWESMYYFHTFGSLESPLAFRISPRANIGDPGYALLEFSRLLVEKTSLRLSIEVFRIGATICGMLTLFFFYRYSARYFGPFAALAATSLLSVNEVFHLQQHTVTVLIVTAMAFVFFIERLQKIQQENFSRVDLPLLSLAITLLLVHYGLGRIYGFLYLIFWIIIQARILRQTNFSYYNYKILTCVLLCIAIALIVLSAIDSYNFNIIKHGIGILIPRTAEFSFNPEYAKVSASLFDTLLFNSKILLESIVTNGGDFHSIYSTYSSADFRYPLIKPYVGIIVFCGLLISLNKMRLGAVDKYIPYLTVIVLLAITIIPILFSSVFYKSNYGETGMLGTISNHRLFFILIPLYLFVSVFFSELFSKFKNNKLGVVVIIIVVASFYTMSLYSIVRERTRFLNQISSVDHTLSGAAAYKQWLDGTPNFDRPASEFISHFQQHAQYYNAAREINDYILNDKTGNNNFIFFVDSNRFSEAPLQPNTLPYLSGINYHLPYLSLYTADFNLNVGFFLMLSPSRNKYSIGFTQPREYSAKIIRNKIGDLEYEDSDNLYGNLLRFGRQDDQIILLTTTPRELEVARAWFQESGISYQFVPIVMEPQDIVH